MDTSSSRAQVIHSGAGSTRSGRRIVASASWVDVTSEVWDEMPHVWRVFADLLPESCQAIERIGGWLQAHYSRGRLCTLARPMPACDAGVGSSDADEVFTLPAGGSSRHCARS